MNQLANYIKQRLSLRAPLQDSLDIVATLSEAIGLDKETDLAEALNKVHSSFKTCTDFERSFPSLCFAIATGVGKTRLMGACIAYLHLHHGVRNFFVLAPNITIYDKLIDDFGNPANPKYVFSGIAEFVHNRPVIITGDNYDTHAATANLYQAQEIRINVFNISKFNRDAAAPNRGAEKGKAPRIKRLSEVLGQSYWAYLSGLDDLVILMDEAHRYKADASSAAINELKPVFGIELTATPMDEKGNVFKNVVYEYSLAQALADGKYVKNPAIAYRSDFDANGRSDKEVEMVKLEDAISLHEDVKTELEIYAINNNVKKVKPFILVVCRDTTHAKEILDYIKSDSFFRGIYADKVIQIDSSVNDEQNARLLETVEHYDNPVEIVVHVNMLAEGWDVTNLYTICPLRKADSIKLIEQTIGRGLRLPYNGERTGVEKIDRLTVVAHDNFQKVIDAAQDPNSILKKFSFVELSNENPIEKTVPVISVSTVQVQQQEEQKQIATIQEPKEKQKAQNSYDAKRLIINSIATIGKMEGVTKIDDLNKPEIKQEVLQRIEKVLSTGQQNLFKADILNEAEIEYGKVLNDYKALIIEIPRIDLVQDQIETWFEDFDLDTTTGFDLRVLREEILIHDLHTQQKSRIGVQHGAQFRDKPVNQVISELINYPEVDYDQCAHLLHKLATQALDKLTEQLTEPSELPILVRQSKKLIASRIWEQMVKHFKLSEPKYSQPSILPFTEIVPWSGSALQNNGYKDYRETITPTSHVPRYVYMGFNKACHPQYKFDSKSEKDFAQILEQDKEIIKWLRPADKQFRIYWSNNARQYHPDFVVETNDTIYLVEVKARDEINTHEVQDKKRAAEMYCSYATEYTTANGGKPWKYIIVPHDMVSTNSTLGKLLNESR
jgi:type III restriction enzyme